MANQQDALSVRAKSLLRAKTFFFLALLFNGYLVIRLPLSEARSPSPQQADAQNNQDLGDNEVGSGIALDGKNAFENTQAAIDSADSALAHELATSGEEAVAAISSPQGPEQVLPPDTDVAIQLAKEFNSPAVDIKASIDEFATGTISVSRQLTRAFESSFRVLFKTLTPRISIDFADGNSETETSVSEPKRDFVQLIPKPSMTLYNSVQFGDVTLLVDGEIVVLPAGQSERFEGGPVWQVEFHRGGEFGDAAQSLIPGQYYFSVTPREGWQLNSQERSAEQSHYQ